MKNVKAETWAKVIEYTLASIAVLGAVCCFLTGQWSMGLVAMSSLSFLCLGE